MAIKIFCDLCESEREIAQVKGVEVVGTGLALTAPSMASGHFVCEECLSKIGWSAESANLTQTDTDGHRRTRTGADGDGLTRDAGRKAAKRRRGVAVLLTWKNDGSFEILNSIAAACDRIGERTGKVISGADISHALLKERVFNADGFMVKYANSASENNKLDRPDTPDRQGADGEEATREAGNELKLEEAGA